MPATIPLPAHATPTGRHAASWRALTAFHLRGGTRAALRTGTIGVAAVIFAFGSAPDPGYTFMTFVLGVVGRGGRRPTDARVFVALLALALASLGARRVTLGASGWPRSLPVAGGDARRAAWCAATFAALSVMLLAVAAPVLTVVAYHAPLDLAKVVTLPLLLAGAGAASLRVERALARLVAGAALLAAASGTWPALPVAAGALLLWDRVAGGLAAPARAQRVRRSSGGRWLPPRASALAMAVRWAWRAIGWRAMAEAWIAAAVPVAFTAFVRANNPDLSPAASATIARVGAALGVVFSITTIGAALLSRRAPWPWTRALPWSAAERVVVDVVVIGAPALVVGIAAAVVHGPMVLGAAGASLVVAVAAAAGALRVGARRQTGAAGETVLLAVPAAVAVSLWPWLAWAAPIAALALGAWAARRDRRSADAVRWNELRHDVSGDVGWITRT